jgi:hypothetical protein
MKPELPREDQASGGGVGGAVASDEVVRANGAYTRG